MNYRSASTFQKPSDIHAKIEDLREWLRPSKWGFTDFVTLASNDVMRSPNRMKGDLSQWDRRMNRLMIGNDWSRRVDEQNYWAAFLEGTYSQPHWHILFRLSPDLRQIRMDRWCGNVWHDRARHIWKKICPSGTFDAQPIRNDKIIRYVTKELHFGDNMLYYSFSRSLKVVDIAAAG